MKSITPWKLEYEAEIGRGLKARSNGNEGMARVCARRAAGVIIGEYLLRNGYAHQSSSAYRRLAFFISLPDVDDRCREIASHCLLKVTQNRQLPINIDLLSEVMWLKNKLLVDKTE